MQVQREVEEPVQQEVQDVSVEDVNAINDISIKNAEKIVRFLKKKNIIGYY